MRELGHWPTVWAKGTPSRSAALIPALDYRGVFALFRVYGSWGDLLNQREESDFQDVLYLDRRFEPDIDPADASGAKRTVETATPLLLVTLDGERLPLRMNPPALGEHTDRLLGSLGYAAAEIADLRAAGVVGPS